MRFSRPIFVLLLAGLPGVGALAQGEEPAPLRLDLGYASSYVFRGVERAGDSAQAAVEFNRGGFRGGVWSNLPFNDDGAREVNLNAGYGWQVADGLTLEATAVSAWFSDVPGGGVDRSLEAGVTATLAPAAGFTPSLAYHHDFHLLADTVQASFARSIALTKLGAFLELNFFAGWADGGDWRPDSAGPPQRDGYGYWGGEVRLPYRIGAYSMVVAGLHYAENFNRSATNGAFGSPDRGNLWVTFGVNIDF
jgi:hypothetical protein